MKHPTSLLAGASALCLLAGAAWAQTAPAATTAQPDSSGGVNLSEVVITAAPRGTKKMNSSIAVSSVNANTLQQIAPQSSADLIRSIPGIRAEASGGEGNANISVRGLPVASGGAKYVQFQEDGLPVLDFGDIAFATADTWVKVDYNVANVELVRGGSAGTATSNAPGAIINFISKTGATDGGAVGLTEGLNFGRSRLDFDYGGHLGDGWRFHVGGFYDLGTGPKPVGYEAEDGGQFKANVTKEFDQGFIRLDVKFLDDKSPVWLPVPMAISANGNNLNFSSLPGFSIQNGALQTPALKTILSVNQNGGVESTNLGDGYHAITKAVGGEFSYKFGNGVKIDDKVRLAFNSGDFVGPYPGNVDTAANIASSIGGAGSTLTYANGGGPYTGVAVNTVMFDVKLNNFNNYTNEFNISKDFEAGAYGSGSLTLGYFFSRQNINMDWHWTDYVLGAQGQNAPLLNVVNGSGATVTANGLVAYDAQAFGGCCVENYNLRYTINAPLLDLNWKVSKFNFDGSIRYDNQHVDGTYAQSNGTVESLNVNGGTSPLTLPEMNVLTVDNADPTRSDYSKHYWSYSVGGNYEFNPNFAVYARVSRAGRMNADRVADLAVEGVVANDAALDIVKQQEVGARFRTPYFSGSATLFHSTTVEYDCDISADLGGDVCDFRDFRAYGAELEGNAHYGIFNLYAGVTYTDAKITADTDILSDVGLAPQRQAKWVYQIRPTVSWQKLNVGGDIVGTSSSIAVDGSPYIQPAYVTVGAFGTYDVTHRLQVQVHADNLFNTVGITEVDQLPNAAGVGAARSIMGREITGGVKYSF